MGVYIFDRDQVFATGVLTGDYHVYIHNRELCAIHYGRTPTDKYAVRSTGGKVEKETKYTSIARLSITGF